MTIADFREFHPSAQIKEQIDALTSELASILGGSFSSVLSPRKLALP